ncbi:23S rRNA (guanosine(2251)-2'-O)-methyltransferase RlmB [Parabacteroides sp. 52]|uniref:23S rRNA (guanosine(2251)-2'-O)-methyltransferase RlmB n=1 Tax=unclassified Parabacteroides TaxID=2649774 RepID=UPI0013D801AF|nr:MULTISPECIES: 23S rRNA (guanosine(2251)-2'-O)-methyltransferase RlmB [unclassified Parabacteroides]MDH6533808.1 23S rRNA (guanosine2251-2'-O)-methyltransferase [Parabacteroides sp. PM5-20]NDV54558.1 23S rRNA (guanosine(2251)-2'-O)-methyltransferase RlmB [Parabacteroides sp. 52]
MRENEMIFGIRAVIEAIQADKEIDKILVKRELQSELSRELFAVLKERDIPVQRVPAERLDRLTRKNHQGVIAFISSVTYQKLEDIIPFVYEAGKNPFIVLLDGVTDVRNFGAIARTCECAGVDAVVIPAKGSVTVNADAIKTSAGALHVLPVCKEKNINQAIRFLQQSGVKVFAATEKAVDVYTQVAYEGPVAIVMGAEDTGVSSENLRICDGLVKIPQFGTIGSLNVSVAASVMVYEVVRQRMNESV